MENGDFEDNRGYDEKDCGKPLNAMLKNCFHLFFKGNTDFIEDIFAQVN